MDTETAEVIERINARIDALEVTLRAEIRDEVRGSLAESKHDALTLNESVRDDIRILAENVAVMSVKLDSLRR